MRVACEKAKKDLSSCLKTEISVDALAEGEDFVHELTRAKFEAICECYFERCMPIVKKVLEDANLDKSKIDEVILVGGSSRIPRV